MNPCALCPRQNRLVPLSGPRRRGGILFIGEAPGRDENREGIPFVGKTGKEVNEHYLGLAGLARIDVDFTNAIKCLPVSNGGKLDTKRPADRALLESCAAQHLYQEILQLEPSLLVPMGAFACRAVDPSIELDFQHGFPIETQWAIPAFPMYHPARGMHEPKKMLELREDWRRLGLYLDGKLYVPEDTLTPDYAEVTDPEELSDLNPKLALGCDTETSPSQGPYFLTYSTRPGMGRLIRRARQDLLDAFQAQLDRWEGPILFHHWLYDSRIVTEMGLRFPTVLISDTMVRAYHLGCLPQALKALSKRELGMVMQDFEDLVFPFSSAKLLEYYRTAQTITWPKPEPFVYLDEKEGKFKIKKPQSMNTKLKRFFTDYAKSDGEKNPFLMIEKNWVQELPMLEAHLGPAPRLDIADVPFEQALFYACRDADALVRLDPILSAIQERAEEMRPVEEWR